LQALHRRATARTELGNYSGAITDLESAQRLDPESKEIADLLQKARTKAGKKKGEDEKPMKRMQIEEVEEEEGLLESDGQKLDSKAAGDVRRGNSELEAEHTSQSAGRKGDVLGLGEGGDAVREKRSEGQHPILEAKSTESTNPDRVQRESSAGAEQSHAHQSNGTAVDQKQPDTETRKEADGAKLAEEWREKGNVLYKRGDTTGAEACYTHSLTYSKTAAALSNRAMCRNKVGKYREAEDDASAAIEVDGTYVKAYHRRAAARRGQNKKEQAMEDYKVRNRFYVLVGLPSEPNRGYCL
jgi:tetratricopeptide (TPR) repeat protein